MILTEDPKIEQNGEFLPMMDPLLHNGYKLKKREKAIWCAKHIIHGTFSNNIQLTTEPFQENLGKFLQ